MFACKAREAVTALSAIDDVIANVAYEAVFAFNALDAVTAVSAIDAVTDLIAHEDVRLFVTLLDTVIEPVTNKLPENV